MQSTSCQLPQRTVIPLLRNIFTGRVSSDYIPVPVSQLGLHHVVNQRLGILSVLSYIGTGKIKRESKERETHTHTSLPEVEVRICATAYCKVVNISEDVYSVGKCSLSANILLKGCLQKLLEAIV